MVSWTQVPEVNLRIRHDEFDPMVLRLRRSWPYVFQIRNRDDYVHTFKSGKSNKPRSQYRVTLIFDGEHLSRIDSQIPAEGLPIR